jgi:hypothetical protein
VNRASLPDRPSEPTPPVAGAGFRAARLAILREIGNGALELRVLPAHWPLTRLHVRVFVERLAQEGLVTQVSAANGTGPRVQLTEAGLRLVARHPHGPSTQPEQPPGR